MSLLHKSFIGPLKDPHLLLVYLSLFLGAVSNYFINIYLAIDMVRMGYASIVIYMEGWLGIAGFILFPLFFYSFTKFSKRGFVALVLGSQIAGTLLLFASGMSNDPLYLGIVRALFATAYYQMLHINLAAHASEDNRGFEMSLAQSIGKMGGILGAVLGGFLVSVHIGVNPMLMAFLLQLLATLGLVLTSPPIKTLADHETAAKGQVHVEDFWQTFKKYPRQNWGTAAEAFFEVTVMLMIPIWLTLQGIGSIMVGLLKALEAVLAIFIVPIAGRIVHRQKGEEFFLGSAAGTLAWLPFLIGTTGAGVIFSIINWSLAGSLIQSGLETRRYSRRSATQVFVREIILTLVRMPAIPVVAWLAFYATNGYIALGITACVLAGLAGRALANAPEESRI